MLLFFHFSHINTNSTVSVLLLGRGGKLVADTVIVFFRSRVTLPTTTA